MVYEDVLIPKQEYAGTAPSLMSRNREIVPNLRAQRQELEARIHKIDKLLQLLERNPEFIQMMDLTRELI